MKIQLPPPANWQDFEDFCRRLWAAIWNDPDTQKNGRLRQPQAGVDVYGRPDRGSSWAGVQCKGKSNYSGSKLTPREVRDEVDKAKGFQPPLSQYIIATTGPTDGKVQEVARKLTDEHIQEGLFSVTTLGWEEIVERLRGFEELYRWYLKSIGSVEGWDQTGLWQVPYHQNQYFVGRTEILDTMKADLSPAGGKGSPVILTGLGGVGKTQLALEFVFGNRRNYEHVLWIRSETEESCLSDLRILVGPDTHKRAEILSEARAWLESNSRWLTVFDNAGSIELIGTILPTKPNGRTIITTRNPSPFQGLFATLPVQVGEMSRREAREFLLKRSGRHDSGRDVSSVEVLLRELGYLPLAIEQAAGYLHENPLCTFDKYLENYRAKGLEVLEKSPPSVGPYSRSVATTWAISFDAVDKESEASSQLLKLIAYLVPDYIPVSLFPEAAPVTWRSLPLKTVETDKLAVHELLSPLIRYSLIKTTKDRDAVSVHRLVQAVTRQRLSVRERRLWAARAVALKFEVRCLQPGTLWWGNQWDAETQTFREPDDPLVKAPLTSGDAFHTFVQSHRAKFDGRARNVMCSAEDWIICEKLNREPFCQFVSMARNTSYCFFVDSGVDIRQEFTGTKDDYAAFQEKYSNQARNCRIALANPYTDKVVAFTLIYLTEEGIQCESSFCVLGPGEIWVLNPLNFIMPGTTLNVRARLFGPAQGVCAPIAGRIFASGRFLVGVTVVGNLERLPEYAQEMVRERDIANAEDGVGKRIKAITDDPLDLRNFVGDGSGQGRFWPKEPLDVSEDG